MKWELNSNIDADPSKAISMNLNKVVPKYSSRNFSWCLTLCKTDNNDFIREV